MDFREQIRRNAWRLRLFLLATFVAAAVAGRLAGEAFLFTVAPEQWYGLEEAASPPWYASYPNQVAASLLLLVAVFTLRMRRRGDRVLLGLAGAEPLRERRARNTVAEMALAAGIEPPPLHVVEDASLNAFACGAGKRYAIVVTRGLLERLDRDEVQAVVAHETAHIRNGDTALMTLLLGVSRVFTFTAAFAFGPLAAMVAAARSGGGAGPPPRFAARRPPSRPMTAKQGVLLLLATPFLALAVLALSVAVSIALLFVFFQVLRFLPWIVAGLALVELWKLAGDGRPPARPPRNLLALCFLVPVGLVAGPAILLLGLVFPALFLLLRLAISRNREFDADATAVELTRDPDALLGALVALRDDAAAPTALPRALTPLAIRPRDGGGIARWLSTHPSLDERIARLEAMGAQSTREAPLFV